jgi:hypothetical protein
MKYCIFVGVYCVPSYLLHEAIGYGHVIRGLIGAFIFIDAGRVWRRLRGRRESAEPGRPREPWLDRGNNRALALVTGGIIICVALALGSRAIRLKRNLTLLSTEHFAAEVFALDKAAASQAVAALEEKLPTLEAAFGLKVTDRPKIRVYDWDDFGGASTLGRFVPSFAEPGVIQFRVGTDASHAQCEHTPTTVLVHEYAHFLVCERCVAAAGSFGLLHLPRWLNDGLAGFFGGGVDRKLTPAELVPLSRIKQAETNTLYEESYLIVRYLMETYGPDKTLSLIEAYSLEKDDPLTAIIGVDGDTLVDLVRTAMVEDWADAER